MSGSIIKLLLQLFHAGRISRVSGASYKNNPPNPVLEGKEGIRNLSGYSWLFPAILPFPGDTLSFICIYICNMAVNLISRVQLEARVRTLLKGFWAGSAGVPPACMKNSCDIDSRSLAGGTPALPVAVLPNI
jgi:hypothetical protein